MVNFLIILWLLTGASCFLTIANNFYKYFKDENDKSKDDY